MTKTLYGMIVLLGLLACGPVQAAALFKWTDKDGVVHFSDQPHAERQAERITMPRSGTPAASPPAAPDVAGDAAETGEQEDAQARHQREIRAANCEIARRTLEHNSSIDRMFRLDEYGERVFLSDEEREALLKRSRDDVAQWCD
jgi:hypothetical protein